MRETDPRRLCEHHTPDRLRYIAAHEDAERRHARGEVQTQCPVCKIWLWPHEQGMPPVQIAPLTPTPLSEAVARLKGLVENAPHYPESADIQLLLDAVAEGREDRKPWMQTMGLSGLAQHMPEPGEVLLSIGSHGERWPDECSRYADVCRVEFDDDQHGGWEKRGRNLKGMDAGRIVRFVRMYRDTAPRLTIHCAAGASRSVSIAQALAVAFNIPHPHAFILNYGAYFRVYDAARQILSKTSVAPPPAPTEPGQ